VSLPPEDPSIRVDKWLWHARFFKSRTLAAKFCASGKLRLNRVPIAKAHATVRPGDVLTFPLGRFVRVIEVAAIGTRRGPAPEAQALYRDLAPPAPEEAAPRPEGSGRPSKRERRALDRLRGRA
jgi:ribosome-associated heat shock protein Hsp15